MEFLPHLFPRKIYPSWWNPKERCDSVTLLTIEKDNLRRIYLTHSSYLLPLLSDFRSARCFTKRENSLPRPPVVAITRGVNTPPWNALQSPRLRCRGTSQRKRACKVGFFEVVTPLGAARVFICASESCFGSHTFVSWPIWSNLKWSTTTIGAEATSLRASFSRATRANCKGDCVTNNY
eukprot:sb/3471736/